MTRRGSPASRVGQIRQSDHLGDCSLQGDNMRALSSAPPGLQTKSPTGITGFDEITNGGLPRGRTTLLVGGPGSGKTILSLQFLMHGALNCKEPGVFVAFEEPPACIIANSQGFGWKLENLKSNKLFF